MADFDVGEGEPIESFDVGSGEEEVFDVGDGELIQNFDVGGKKSQPPVFKEGSLEMKDLELTQKIFGKGEFGQAVHAYAYAAAETMIDLSPVTFMKYLRTEDRDKFMSMSKTDQHKELLWDTLMTELFLGAGAVANKVIPKAIKFEKETVYPWIGKGVKKLRGIKPKPQPINYPQYNSYTKEAKDLIMKQERVSEREASAIVEHIQGNPNAVNLLEKEVSPAFESIAKKTDKGLFVKSSKIDQYSPKRVQMEASRQRFVDAVQNKLGVQDKGVILEDIESVYKGGLRKLYGEQKYDVSYKQVFKDAAPELLDDMTRHIMDSPQNKVMKMYELYSTPSPIASLAQPIRFVAQRLEPVLKVHSKIYQPIKEFGDRVTDQHLVNLQEFMKLATNKGLAKETKLAGKLGFKRTRLFTKERLDTTYKILRTLDDKNQTPDSLKFLLKKTVPDPKEREIIGHIADITRDWLDGMYAKQAISEIPKAFEKLGMTGNNRAGLYALLRNRKIGNETFKGIDTRIQELFDPKNAKSFSDKSTGMKQILLELQGYAESIGADKNSITKYLSMENGDFTKYLENYFPRIAQKEVNLADKVMGRLPEKHKAFYKQQRIKAVMDDPPVDFEDAITRYSRANAREVTGYFEVMDDAIKHLNQLPSDNATSYMAHWVGKKLGLPTNADVSLARLLNHLPGKGWDAKRVMTASRIIQNAAVSGFLGFKPFSMARNMFQPLIMTPAELGKNGFKYFVKGLRHAADKNHVSEMKRLKIFTDPMPDYERHLKFLRFGKGRKYLGFELPTYQGVVDSTLMGYKGSDAWNRIWTSGAAKSQWLAGLRAIGIKEINAIGVPTSKIAKKFLHNINVVNRTDVARYNIENLVGKGKWYEAYTEHIRDIVANAQFLYGVDDAPLALHPSLGSAGRALTVFQSWWMNYGQAMAHWMATGVTPSEKMLKAFNWGLSGLIANGIMNQIWGSDVGTRSTWLGPFPAPRELATVFVSSPVALQVSKGMETVWNAGTLGFDFALGADQEEIDKSTKAFERSAKSFLRASVNLWMPAGLVSRQMLERGVEAPSGQKLKEIGRAFMGLKEKDKIPAAR